MVKLRYGVAERYKNCHLVFFTGSSSNPDEDRLLKHLLDPNHQRYNVQTTPVASVNESILVIVGIGLRKLIALVKSKHLVVHQIARPRAIYSHCLYFCKCD